MSYASQETSTESSLPVWLVRFTQGGTDYNYTTIAETISRLSVSWFPVAMEIGQLSASGEVPKDTLSIKLPYNNTLAYTFVGYVPDSITTVTVWRTHYDDTDVQVMFKGRVGSTSISGRMVDLQCDPVFASIKRRGPRRVYQRTCPFMLFGRGCNVNPTGYDYAMTATAVVGPLVTVTGSGAVNFVGGTLRSADGVIRMIVSQSGDVVRLMRPIRSMELGSLPASVTLFIGCSHTTDGCVGFGNLGNFGGQPGIPLSNPMANQIVTVQK